MTHALISRSIANFRTYFQGEGIFSGLGVVNLDQNYDWPKKGSFPELKGLSDKFSQNMSNFEKTILMKQTSAGLWANGNHKELAEWIIKVWGGIRRISEEKISNYVERFEAGFAFKHVKGSASYSKMLSFARPNDFPIYDARVATSLNVIQDLVSSSNPVFFEVGQSRNRIVKEYSDQIQHKRRARAKQGWELIPKTVVYEQYCALLHAYRAELEHCPVWELEMALFADTEKLIDLLRKI